MSRWVGIVGLGLLLALFGIVVLRPGAPRTDAVRAAAIAAELRCPDCAGLSVADSHTAAAVEIRRQIDVLLVGGATDEEIRDHFVDRYGEWILLQPSTPAYWVIPLIVAVGAVIGLGAWLLARRRGVTEDEPSRPMPDEEQRRRLHDEVERLDA
jgi:cytochrome c-type biogenesis protein CcmH